MIILSHISYPTLLFVLLAKWLNLDYSVYHLAILILFSVFPDIDFLYHKFVKNGKYDYTFMHHKWVLHWPILYLPLVMAALLYPSQYLLLAIIGIYSHLVLDSFMSGDGIMWLYPFSRKFYNFFGEGIRNRHGHEWLNAYRKTNIYKIDMVCFGILLLILARM